MEHTIVNIAPSSQWVISRGRSPSYTLCRPVLHVPGPTSRTTSAGYGPIGSRGLRGRSFRHGGVIGISLFGFIFSGRENFEHSEIFRQMCSTVHVSVDQCFMFASGTSNSSNAMLTNQSWQARSAVSVTTLKVPWHLVALPRERLVANLTA